MPQLKRAEGVRAAAASRPTPSSSTSSSSPPTSQSGAVDVILLDTTFWGGIRPCIKAAGVCETMGLGVAVHSSGELGIQLATMLHLGAVRAEPRLRGRRALSPPDRRRDRRRPMRYENGAIRVPDAPGLGVALDRDKLARYHELFRELGGYPYDRDPGRPGWFAHVPNRDWADPAAAARHAVADGATRPHHDGENATMTGRLAGKTALVTAAGQGIGCAPRRADGARRRDRLRDRRQPEAARRASRACANVDRAPARRARRRRGRDARSTSCRRSTCCSTAPATSTTARSSTARRRTGTSASTSTCARCTSRSRPRCRRCSTSTRRRARGRRSSTWRRSPARSRACPTASSTARARPR